VLIYSGDIVYFQYVPANPLCWKDVRSQT